MLPRREIGPGVPNWLFAVLESNVAWRGRHRLEGVADESSGGFTRYLAPGLQWITLRTILEAAVQIPLIQELNGQALREDFIARLSFRASF